MLDRTLEPEAAVHRRVSEAEEELILADIARVGLDLGKEALERLQRVLDRNPAGTVSLRYVKCLECRQRVRPDDVEAVLHAGTDDLGTLLAVAHEHLHREDVSGGDADVRLRVRLREGRGGGRREGGRHLCGVLLRGCVGWRAEKYPPR